MSDRDIDRLPPGWAVTTLGEVNDLPVSQGGPEQDFVYVDISSIDNQAKRIVEPKHLTLSSAPSRARQRLKPGDVLISMTRPNLNAVAMLPEQMAGAIGSTGFHVIRSSLVQPAFLWYLVQSFSFVKAMSDLVLGVLYPAVRPKDISAFKFALPPIEEQLRIVAEIEKQFSRLDAGIAALKRVQANLKRYRASVLRAACEGRLVATEAELARQEGREYEPADALLKRILAERRARWEADQMAKMEAQGRLPLDNAWKAKYQEPAALDKANLPELPEGWCWANVDALCSFVTSGSRGWAAYYAAAGAQFIRIGNLSRGKTALKMNDIQHVQPLQNAEGERTRLQPHDVLISITANLGSVGLVPASIGEAYINQHIALCRPLCLIDAAYLAWYLSSEGGQNRLFALQRGATKVGLGLEDIRQVALPMPPLLEQNRIVAEVERRLSIVEEVEATVAANLKRAERLRQAILHRAFSGKLVPQDPNDEPASVLLERIRAVQTTPVKPKREKTNPARNIPRQMKLDGVD